MIDLHLSEGWSEEELYALQIAAVDSFMKCDSVHAVEAAVEFAKVLNEKGLDADNYPLFLELLREENYHVIEALLEGENPFDFFKAIQPNHYMIEFCFELLASYSPGGVHEKTLGIVFGILYRNYHRAREGWQLYPLSIENVNALGKFLDKEKDQNDDVNRFILDILADLAEYTSQYPEDERINEIAAHAIDIRNAFFDRRRKMSSVMPPEILKRENYMKTTISPRKTKPYTEKKAG
jgi:hypothetical protein